MRTKAYTALTMVTTYPRATQIGVYDTPREGCLENTPVGGIIPCSLNGQESVAQLVSRTEKYQKVEAVIKILDTRFDLRGTITEVGLSFP
jgi:hypothetical protein